MKPSNCPHRILMYDKGYYGCFIPGGHPAIIDACSEQDDDLEVCSNSCIEQRNENYLNKKYGKNLDK